MSYLLHRNTKTSLPLAVAGDGPYIIDGEGRRYLDASGGAAVSCLGHSHPAVIEAVVEQIRKLPFAHTGFFTNAPYEALAENLVTRAPDGIAKVYFVSGGSEANETAMKLARQYFLEIGQPERRHFIARRQSYHGNTLGALAAGGNAARRRPYEPMLVDVPLIDPCYAYRHQEPGESDEAYGRRAADALEQKLLELGPETVIGFLAETVVGATAGAVPPAPGYLARIREICDRYGVLLILDEVMCGMGRSGTLFACEQEGVTPDLVTCAKGLGAGYQPIGACLMNHRVYDAIDKGSGVFQHGFTYIGHATACAAALAVQQTIEAENLLAAVRDKGAALRAALTERFGQHPHVGDIRGRGLFLALELVRDRQTKACFDPAAKLNARIKRAAMELGLICYPGGGTADGSQGDHILLAPPFILEPAHLDELVEKLAGSLEVALSEIAEPAA